MNNSPVTTWFSAIMLIHHGHMSASIPGLLWIRKLFVVEESLYSLLPQKSLYKALIRSHKCWGSLFSGMLNSILSLRQCGFPRWKWESSAYIFKFLTIAQQWHICALYSYCPLGRDSRDPHPRLTSRMDVCTWRICSWPLSCRMQILQDSWVVVGV